MISFIPGNFSAYVTAISVTISIVAFAKSQWTMFKADIKWTFVCGIFRLLGWALLVLYLMELVCLPFLLALLANLVVAASLKFNGPEILVNSLGSVFIPFYLVFEVRNNSR